MFEEYTVSKFMKITYPTIISLKSAKRLYEICTNLTKRVRRPKPEYHIWILPSHHTANTTDEKPLGTTTHPPRPSVTHFITMDVDLETATTFDTEFSGTSRAQNLKLHNFNSVLAEAF